MTALLRPPLHENTYDDGLGTVYTAHYEPGEGRVTSPLAAGESWSPVVRRLHGGHADGGAQRSDSHSSVASGSSATTRLMSEGARTTGIVTVFTASAGSSPRLLARPEFGERAEAGVRGEAAGRGVGDLVEAGRVGEAGR